MKDFALVMKWEDGEWQEWEELQTDATLASLKEDAQLRLDRAKGAISDMGKGKQGPIGAMAAREHDIERFTSGWQWSSETSCRQWSQEPINSIQLERRRSD